MPQQPKRTAKTSRIPDLPLSWHVQPVNPDRLARFLALPKAERIVLAEHFAINKAEMFQWAGRLPQEVPLVNGEFFFIAGFMADLDDD